LSMTAGLPMEVYLRVVGKSSITFFALQALYKFNLNFTYIVWEGILMKKLLSGITAMMLVIGLFTTGVQAKMMSNQEINSMIEKTNKEIYALVDKADEKADAVVLRYQSGKISEEEQNVRIDEIVSQLIELTTNKAEKLIRETAKMGIVIEAEWVEVEVGGRIVLVDPCMSDGV
jgi:hypothetical protein